MEAGGSGGIGAAASRGAPTAARNVARTATFRPTSVHTSPDFCTHCSARWLQNIERGPPLHHPCVVPALAHSTRWHRHWHFWHPRSARGHAAEPPPPPITCCTTARMSSSLRSSCRQGGSGGGDGGGGGGSKCVSGRQAAWMAGGLPLLRQACDAWGRWPRGRAASQQAMPKCALPPAAAPRPWRGLRLRTHIAGGAVRESALPVEEQAHGRRVDALLGAVRLNDLRELGGHLDLQRAARRGRRMRDASGGGQEDAR